MNEDSTVSCYDRHARAYDFYQSAVVPGYQEMLDLVTEACQRYLPQEAKIIDLGCGTAMPLWPFSRRYHRPKSISSTARR